MSDRRGRDQSAERHHAHVRGAASDVNHHRPEWLRDRQPCPDGRGDRLLDTMDASRAGLTDRPFEGASLHRAYVDVDAERDLAMLEPADPDPMEDLGDHRRGDVDVDELSRSNRADHRDVPGRVRTKAHRRSPEGEQAVARELERGEGRLLEEDLAGS